MYVADRHLNQALPVSRLQGACICIGYRGTRINGVVRFADGQPGSGASIQLESESSVDSESRSRQTIADANGRFELKGVVTGSYRIVAPRGPYLSQDTLHIQFLPRNDLIAYHS